MPVPIFHKFEHTLDEFSESIVEREGGQPSEVDSSNRESAKNLTA